MENHLKEHKDTLPIAMLLRLGKFVFLSLVVIIIFVYIGCKHNYGKLDSVFELLKDKSPDYLISQFKNSDLDSVVVYHPKFVNEIKNIMSDSIVESNIKTTFKSYGIAPIGKQVEWTFLAAFHKYLNKDKYNIPKLLDRMIEMSDSINEIKYGHLRKEINYSTEQFPRSE